MGRFSGQPEVELGARERSKADGPHAPSALGACLNGLWFHQWSSRLVTSNSDRTSASANDEGFYEFGVLTRHPNSRLHKGETPTMVRDMVWACTGWIYHPGLAHSEGQGAWFCLVS
jgi:hypothetical protein